MTSDQSQMSGLWEAGVDYWGRCADSLPVSSMPILEQAAQLAAMTAKDRKFSILDNSSSEVTILKGLFQH